NIHVATFAMPPLNLAAQGNIAAAVTSAALERERIRDAVGALPGVQKLTMSGGEPGILGSVMGFGIADPNDPTKRLMLQALPVDEHYVDVLGLTLLHGRTFGPDEPAAVLVNRALARLLFGRDDVVGESIPFSLVSGQRSEIVGVLDDLSYQHPLADVTPMAFIQSTSSFVSSNLALIESTLSSAALRRALQGLVDSGAVEALTISDVTPLAARRSTMLAPDRARSFLTIGTA